MNKILFVGEHPRTYNVCWHSHDYWELVYCTDGEGEFRLKNGSSIRYHRGQAVAIPPHEVHMNTSREGFTNIHLTMEAPLFPHRTAFMVNDDDEKHIYIAFSEAKFYYLSDIKMNELVLAALSELIVSYMIVYQNKWELSPPVEQIRTSIQQNYTDPSFALDEELRKQPFQYDYLRKLFKKEMGATPLEYMTRLRMKKAEVLLTVMWAGNYTMAEVAEQCGFDNALYFSRVFKKNFGCSPTAFSQKSREEPQELE